MARGINKHTVVGNLGADPDVRVSPNGTTVVNFSVATGESWKDKETGERKERTEWHKVVAFGKLAEICRDKLKKGNQVYVEGPSRTEQWDDKDGVTRYTTKIYCEEMELLGGKPSTDSDE